MRKLTRSRLQNLFLPVLFVLLSVLFSHAHAALISRTITIDGDMSDWFEPPAIPANVGQFSDDCVGDQVCDRDFPVSATGRDLKKFAYTWDEDYLYFYVERWLSATNTTNWLFYLDQNANELMEDTESIFRVVWSGNNRRTDAYLCLYIPDVDDGDPLVDADGYGDGYTMPGKAGVCTDLYSNIVAGADPGVAMESRVSWEQLGMSGPGNIKFHISSSQGDNLPTHVNDNMNGPGDGGGLFPPDMSIAITASSAQVYSGQTVTFDVTLTNVLYTEFTNVDIAFNLPPGLVYQSHIAPVGTTFIAPYNLWEIPLLAEQDVLVLQVTALAQSVVNPTNTMTDVSLTSSTPADTNAANNNDSVDVEILPIPELLVTKSALPLTADPNTEVVFTSIAANVSTVNASTIIVTEDLPLFSSYKLGSLVFNNQAPPYDDSTLTVFSTEYFDGNDWTYVPVSGAGGAPAGYDATVKNIRITFNGNIPPNGAFSIIYTLLVN